LDKKINKFYKDKKVLITGVTGFKGAWLCQWLLLLGAKVFGCGFNPNKNKDLFYSLGLDKKINLNFFDIRSLTKTKNYISRVKPDIIFHLAAQPLIYNSYKKPFLTYNVNTIGTLNILEAVRFSKSVKALVCITSDKCYSNNFSTKGFKEDDKLGGDDPYSGSKACSEIIIKSYYESFFKKKTGVASARAGNVIGGGDWSDNRLIPDTIKSLQNKIVIFIRNPNFNRPWQHVLEPLRGYLILAEKIYKKPRYYSGAWNFGTEKNTITTVLEIVKQIIQIWGSGKVIANKKNKFKFYEQKNLQLNISKSKKFLNWKPIFNVKQSISFTVDWYKKVIINKIDPVKITINQIVEYMNAFK
jgi:CDP-glucose 4,6-dehydratase